MWFTKKIKTVSKRDDFGVKWQVYHDKSCDISHRGRVSLDVDLPQQIQLQAAWWMCCLCGRTTILLSKRQQLILSTQGCKMMLAVCACKEVSVMQTYTVVFLSELMIQNKVGGTNLICYAAV